MSSLKDFCKDLDLPHSAHSPHVNDLYNYLKTAPREIKANLVEKVRALARSLKVVDGVKNGCVRLLRYNDFDDVFYLEKIDSRNPYYFGLDVDEVVAKEHALMRRAERERRRSMPRKSALCIPVSTLLHYVKSAVGDPEYWMERRAEAERRRRNVKLLGKHVLAGLERRREHARMTLRERKTAARKADVLEKKAIRIESALRHFTSLDEAQRKRYKDEINALQEEITRLRLMATVPARKGQKDKSPRGAADLMFGWKKSRSRSKSRGRSRRRSRSKSRSHKTHHKRSRSRSKFPKPTHSLP